MLLVDSRRRDRVLVDSSSVFVSPTLLVDALRRERSYPLGVVLCSVWLYGPSHTWHEFAILELVFLS